MSDLPVFRCSSLDRVLRCHASILLEEKAVYRIVQAITLDGTYIHHQVATELLNYGAFSNEPITEPEFPVGYEPCDIQWAIDYCLRLALDDSPDDWYLMVENHYAWQFERFVLSGHVDYLTMDQACKQAYGKDWKTGYAFTDPAAQNWQVLGYIVLIKHAYPSLETISFDIVQPRANIDDEEDRVSTVTVSGEELDSLSAYLESKLNYVLDNPYLLETGPKQCQYCRAKLICPGIKETRKKMKMKLKPETIEALETEPDDSALVELFIDGKTLEPLIDIVKGIVKRRLEQDRQLVAENGVTLTPKYTKGNINITDTPEFYDRTERLIGAERMRECFKPIIKELRRQISKHLGIPQRSKSKRDAAEVFDAEYRDIIEQATKVEVRING